MLVKSILNSILVYAVKMFIKFYLLHFAFAWIHDTEFESDFKTNAKEKWLIDNHNIYLNEGKF